MTPELYVRAIALNNQGALLFEAGKLKQAHDSFRLAMDSITKGMTKKGETDCSQNGETGYAWSCNPCLPLHAAQPSTFVYQHAITLRAADLASMAECQLESAAIVWNMGLCFFIMGLANPKDRYLRRALKFYELARVIRRIGHRGSQEMIDLALLNNIGQIHCEFLEYAEARSWFNLVSEHLALLHHTGFMTNRVEPQDCDGFVMNVLMAEEPTCSAAA